ncbi:MAG: SAM-dependent methyltransferase [Balneolia bacterium]|nr:SAM-dependent methyltransferase [Balneolia bacterium]
MSIEYGTLYLIPTPLGKNPVNTSIPQHVIGIVHGLEHFAVENIRQAVSFLQWIKHPKEDFELAFFPLSKRTDDLQQQEYINLLMNGTNIGVLTDAGCPGIADPGAGLVRKAHHFGIPVEPLTGPASPILALMGSGLGGQKFGFSGYLPVKPTARDEMIKELEKRSSDFGSTEMFMETPHRNTDTFNAALKVLQNETELSVGASLTLDGQIIDTKPVSEWKHNRMPDIDKIPAIFSIKAPEKPKVDLRRKAVKKKFSR